MTETTNYWQLSCWREMVEQLRAPLAEDTGSIPRIHMAAHNLNSNTRGSADFRLMTRKQNPTWEESTLSLPIYPNGSSSVLMAEKSTEHSWVLLFTWPSVKSRQRTLSALTLAPQVTRPESGEPTRLEGRDRGVGVGMASAPSGRRHSSPGRLAVAATSATNRPRGAA